MTDYFALLEEPRRPWLEEDALKSKFLTLSNRLHPDRFHHCSEREQATRRFAELNAAYACLGNPRDRIRHLLELELGERPPEVQTVPEPMAELGFEVGRLCSRIDRFLKERAQTPSPVLRVRLFQQSQAWLEEIATLQQKIANRRHPLLEELRELNRVWEKANSSTERRGGLAIQALASIYAALSYLGRWTDQLQQRRTELSL